MLISVVACCRWTYNQKKSCRWTYNQKKKLQVDMKLLSYEEGLICKRGDEVEGKGSRTTEFRDTAIGLPSSCSMMLPRTSVSSFLNSSTVTDFPSSAFIMVSASTMILSISSTAPMGGNLADGPNVSRATRKFVLLIV